MVLTTILVFCIFLAYLSRVLSSSTIQTTLHKMGQGSIKFVHMNSFVFYMYRLLMTVYSNSRLWLRRNMARMQQMLVMRVVSLLISRWNINLCRCMAYCWMVTLLHHMIMVFENSGEQGGSWTAQDCHRKSRLYWKSKFSTVLKSDLFPTTFK